jgi:hypothetical protein
MNFGSVVGIATGYGLDNQEVTDQVLVGSRILTYPYQDWLWGSPNFHVNQYWDSFLGVKVAGV